MSPQKEILIEQFAKNYKHIGSPYLAGRVLGLFYVSEQKYYNFEELMEALQLSKSAVSKSLKYLIEIGDIRFIVKDGNKRKRYFYVSEEGFINSMNLLVKVLENQHKILQEIISLRNDENQELNSLIKRKISYLEGFTRYLENHL